MKPAQFTPVLFCLTIATLVSCTETTTTSSGMFGPDTTVQQRGGLFGRGARTSGGDYSGAVSSGTGSFINSDGLDGSGPLKAEIKVVNGDKVELSLVNASISAAAKAVLADTFGLSYVVSPEVSGKITLQTTAPIDKSALLDLFEASLEANGAMIEQQGDVLAIVPRATGNRSFRLASSGASSASVIIVAPLKYVAAKEMVGLLEPLVDEGLSAFPDSNRNLLLLSGNRYQLEAAIDALNLFDVDVLAGKSVALFQLRAADPENVVTELATIFEANEGEMLDGVIEFIPNSRLSSVLVITTRKEYLNKAQTWIRELDRSASSNQRFTQVYPLQNRSAEEVAPILNDLMDDLALDADGGSRAGGASKVAADNSRNALVVRALATEHEELERILVELDSVPQQVILEATIAEVTLNDEVSMGVRWFFEAGKFGVGYSDATSGSVGADYPGFSTVFSAADVQVALNALAGATDVKVISSPSLMVLNNQSAILQIGDEVPIATKTSSDTTTSDSVTTTTIDYRNTGVILEVSPRIGSGGRVILDIRQEVSDVAATNTSGIDSPTIRQREVETHVVLQDGMTLALGGLVQEGDTMTETKVPGLGDIPVVGAAFRTRSSAKTRSELLILIRPRIVDSESTAELVTQIWRSKLSASDSLIETGLGSPTHSLSDLFQ